MSQAALPSLSISALRQSLSDDANAILQDILVYPSLDSTNEQLWRRLDSGQASPAICLAEQQTAGRGRRGDQWQSPATGNLYLSLFWPFPANQLQNGLTIAIGIALINTLKDYGISDLQLKWPNDLLHQRHKLAGILVESRIGIAHYAVIGIGLNYKLPVTIQNKIHQPTTSLEQLCTNVPCRNRLAGKLIQNMIDTVTLFQARGLHDFLPLWPQYDALHDQPIHLISEQRTETAIARGINADGELRYEQQGELHTMSRSDVSIRFAS